MATTPLTRDPTFSSYNFSTTPKATPPPSEEPKEMNSTWIAPEPAPPLRWHYQLQI